jgi:hypothetical protein
MTELNMTHVNVVTRVRNAIKSTGIAAGQKDITIYNDERANAKRRIKAVFKYEARKVANYAAIREAVTKEFGDELIKFDDDYNLCIVVKDLVNCRW